MVPYINPPMVTTAIGCTISEPIPKPIAMVDNPRIVVRAVMMIGLSLVLPASTKAFSFSIPAAINWLV